MRETLYQFKEEAFAAVTSLICAGSIDEAIHWEQLKNGLGHSTCTMTENGRIARQFAREVTVGINIGACPNLKPFYGKAGTQIFLWRRQEPNGIHEGSSWMRKR